MFWLVRRIMCCCRRVRRSMCFGWRFCGILGACRCMSGFRCLGGSWREAATIAIRAIGCTTILRTGRKILVEFTDPRCLRVRKTIATGRGICGTPQPVQEEGQSCGDNGKSSPNICLRHHCHTSHSLPDNLMDSRLGRRYHCHNSPALGPKKYRTEGAKLPQLECQA